MSLTRSTQEYILTEAKIDAVKPNLTTIAKIPYSGNSTVNRAISHGLGVVPMAVLLVKPGAGSEVFRIFSSGEIHASWAAADAVHTVTAADATNFYVGNAASYGQSANLTPVSYLAVVFA